MTLVVDRRATFLAGLEAYRGGHDLEALAWFETLWRDEPEGERRELLQSLVLLAGATHRVFELRESGSATALLKEMLALLRPLADVVATIDVASLRMDCEGFAEALGPTEREVGAPTAEARPLVRVVGELARWETQARAPHVAVAARSTWFHQGLEAYRRGDYFDAHELWEQLWRDEADERHKQLLQGLIQVAASMHKAVTQRMPRPAAALLQRARLRLEPLVNDHHGLQLGRLVREASRAEEVLTRLVGDGGSASFDASLIPTIARELG